MRSSPQDLIDITGNVLPDQAVGSWHDKSDPDSLQQPYYHMLPPLLVEGGVCTHRVCVRVLFNAKLKIKPQYDEDMENMVDNEKRGWLMNQLQTKAARWNLALSLITKYPCCSEQSILSARVGILSGVSRKVMRWACIAGAKGWMVIEDVMIIYSSVRGDVPLYVP